MGDRRVTADRIRSAVDRAGDPERARSSARFFRTGPGEYGEGDQFVGVTVPVLRNLARGFRGVDRATVRDVLDSPIHEHRLIALLLMRTEFDRARSPEDRAAWVATYLDAAHAGRVDNWDLVDTSADPVLGEFCLATGDDGTLPALAAHPDLWLRRIGIVGTFAYLKHGRADLTLAVVPIVIDDRRDLIQKASGWMLREVGKRTGRENLVRFLDDNAARMGRTALRYAIEHLPAEERAHYRGLR